MLRDNKIFLIKTLFNKNMKKMSYKTIEAINLLLKRNKFEILKHGLVLPIRSLFDLVSL